MDPQQGGAAAFHSAIAEAKAAHPAGAAVTLYPADDYKDMRLFTTKEGDAGFALKGNDIVSVFKHPDAPYRNVTKSMLDVAVSQGGRRLDAFDTVLPDLYGQSGFRAVARLPWNDEYTPDGWDHNVFKNHNGGRPDVVFMAHDPQAGSYQPGDGRAVTDYDEGTAHQHAALEHAQRRGNVPAAPGPEAYGSGQLIRMADPTTIWHGTPHEFKPTRVNPLGEFNLSKINTGEGNQSYGKGVYEAENQGIATNYRDELSQGVTYKGKRPVYSGTNPDDLAAHQVAELMHDLKIPAAEAIETIHREYAEQSAQAASWLAPGIAGLAKEANRRRSVFHREVSNAALKLNPEDFEHNEGHLYESELHIDPDHLLHWDHPLMQQSPYIQERVGQLMEEAGMPASIHKMSSGRIVHNWLANEGRAMNDQHQARAARRLLEAGIPGIKDTDASSRDHLADIKRVQDSIFIMRATGASAEDIARQERYLKTFEDKVSHNYVVFDPRTINIVRKNGLPAMVDAGADATRDHKANA